MAPSPGVWRLLQLVVLGLGLPRGALRQTPPASPTFELHVERSLQPGLRVPAPLQRRVRRRPLRPATVSGHTASACWDPLAGFWRPPSPVLRRRCRRLFAQQRRTWGQQKLRRHCGYCAVRVGEALHPGPSSGRGPSPTPAEPAALRRRVQAPDSSVRCF